MASTHNGSPGNCLLLRLSCWYQSNVGESTKQNTKLYRSFSEKELEPAWVLAAVTPSERNDQTKIVAISVGDRHIIFHNLLLAYEASLANVVAISRLNSATEALPPPTKRLNNAARISGMASSYQPSMSSPRQRISHQSPSSYMHSMTI